MSDDREQVVEGAPVPAKLTKTEIGAMGGRAAHEGGLNKKGQQRKPPHKWVNGEDAARDAARKGGIESQRRRKEAREAAAAAVQTAVAVDETAAVEHNPDNHPATGVSEG